MSFCVFCGIQCPTFELYGGCCICGFMLGPWKNIGEHRSDKRMRLASYDATTGAPRISVQQIRRIEDIVNKITLLVVQQEDKHGDAVRVYRELANIATEINQLTDILKFAAETVLSGINSKDSECFYKGVLTILQQILDNNK